MDIPLELIVLLGLPFAAAAVIVAVSFLRRRRRGGDHRDSDEPRHRGQADSAAVQDAQAHPHPDGPVVTSGRVRRAGSARRSTSG